MSDILVALLPFLILLLFWSVLMRYTKRRAAEQKDPILEELHVIREELVRLRKALEQRGIG